MLRYRPSYYRPRENWRCSVKRQGRWRGVEFENLERLLSPDHLSLRPRGGGFPHLREMPRLVFNPEAGDPPRDLEGGFSGYWLMSERLRLAILSVDPMACAFVECDYRLVDGSPGPAISSATWCRSAMRWMNRPPQSRLRPVRTSPAAGSMTWSVAAVWSSVRGPGWCASVLDPALLFRVLRRDAA